MKQSLMSNVIQFYIASTTGSSPSEPLTAELMPCGSFITMVQGNCDTDMYFRLIQDGKQIFPVRSNSGSQYFRLMFNAGLQTVLDDLWIPVNPNYPVKVEYSDAGTPGKLDIILTMASEDERSLLLVEIKKLTGKFVEVVK